MATDFDDAVVAAKKILGKDADIPKPKNDLAAMSQSFTKAYQDFAKARDDTEAKLLALENVLSSGRNAQKQNAAVFEKAEFGLGKSKSDADKIKQAQKIFATYYADNFKMIDSEEKTLDELDKHLIQLGKYKPSKALG